MYNLHPYASVGSHHTAPTRRQVRARSGKSYRSGAAWRVMWDQSRYSFPVTISHR